MIGEDVHRSTVEQDPVRGRGHPQLWAAHGLQVGGVQGDQAAGGQQAYVQSWQGQGLQGQQGLLGQQGDGYPQVPVQPLATRLGCYGKQPVVQASADYFLLYLQIFILNSQFKQNMKLMLICVYIGAFKSQEWNVALVALL